MSVTRAYRGETEQKITPDHSAFAFVLVHNHPSGATSASEADMQLTKRIIAGARILQINFLDHLIVGQAIAGRPGYFSFQEAGML